MSRQAEPPPGTRRTTRRGTPDNAIAVPTLKTRLKSKTYGTTDSCQVCNPLIYKGFSCVRRLVTAECGLEAVVTTNFCTGMVHFYGVKMPFGAQLRKLLILLEFFERSDCLTAP